MEQCKIIIGKNFGDEGKGLVTDFFARRMDGNTIVIKHNGGAQAGHTVERKNLRFVFHQLSSASFCGLPTFMSETYLPDMFKIEEEIQSFNSVSGIIPKIYVDAKCRLTTVYDVIINSLTESLRNDKRHGSCGMGINEAVVRSRDDKFCLTAKTMSKFSIYDTAEFLEKIRTEYIPKRLDELNIPYNSDNQWLKLLCDENISMNAAEIMHTSLKYAEIVENVAELLSTFKNIIFEGAQGLMLDMDNTEFFPHFTPSHTGCKNPIELLDNSHIEHNCDNTEICYVTRSYVTRHGAGFLPYECKRSDLNPCIEDLTNIPNKWQESLRFAKHGNLNEFAKYIIRDRELSNNSASVSLFFTHLNETNDCIATKYGYVPSENFISELTNIFLFDKYYLSDNKFAENVSSFYYDRIQKSFCFNSISKAF